MSQGLETRAAQGAVLCVYVLVYVYVCVLLILAGYGGAQGARGYAVGMAETGC